MKKMTHHAYRTSVAVYASLRQLAGSGTSGG